MTAKASISITLLSACLIFSYEVLACSMSAWVPGASGDVRTNNPANGVARVGGACGLKVSGTGYVQDNGPNTETQFIGRFYFLSQLNGVGSTKIFVAYSDETSTELFSIKYDGANISIDATTATGGGTTSVAVDNNHWNLIEFFWKSGDSGSLWVNADATKDPASGEFASGIGTVESVRLGAPYGFGGLTGVAFFDDYESRRSLPVGALLAGDGNFDGDINSEDLTVIVEEYLFNSYDNGVTDCNLDAEINSGDINCVVSKFQSQEPGCKTKNYLNYV